MRDASSLMDLDNKHNSFAKSLSCYTWSNAYQRKAFSSMTLSSNKRVIMQVSQYYKRKNAVLPNFYYYYYYFIPSVAKPTLIFLSADKGRSSRKDTGYSSVILTVKFSYTFVRAVDINQVCFAGKLLWRKHFSNDFLEELVVTQSGLFVQSKLVYGFYYK